MENVLIAKNMNFQIGLVGNWKWGMSKFQEKGMFISDLMEMGHISFQQK